MTRTTDCPDRVMRKESVERLIQFQCPWLIPATFSWGIVAVSIGGILLSVVVVRLAEASSAGALGAAFFVSCAFAAYGACGLRDGWVHAVIVRRWSRGRRRFPREPWRWSPAWREQVSMGDSRRTFVLALSASLALLLAASPCIYLLVRRGVHADLILWASLAGSGCFIVICLAIATRAHSRWRRCGRVTLQIDDRMGIIGGAFVATLRFERPVSETTGFDVTLTQKSRHLEPGPKGSLRIRRATFWSGRQFIEPGALDSSAGDVTAPVHIEIPDRLPPFDASKSWEIHEWELEVVGREPDSELRWIGTVPVFSRAQLFVPERATSVTAGATT